MREFASICNSVGAEIEAVPGDSTCYEILSGRSNEATEVRLVDPQVDHPPHIPSRDPYVTLDTLREMLDSSRYESIMSIGPHSVALVTPDDGHEFFTTNLDQDISQFNRLSYLDAEDCAALLAWFANPNFEKRAYKGGQTSFKDFR